MTARLADEVKSNAWSAGRDGREATHGGVDIATR
jgi:hypothetical protein